MSTASLMNAEAWKKQIIAWRNGAPVRFADIGTAIDSVENNRTATWLNGKRAIVLSHAAPARLQHHPDHRRDQQDHSPLQGRPAQFGDALHHL